MKKTSVVLVFDIGTQSTRALCWNVGVRAGTEVGFEGWELWLDHHVELQ